MMLTGRVYTCTDKAVCMLTVLARPPPSYQPYRVFQEKGFFFVLNSIEFSILPHLPRQHLAAIGCQKVANRSDRIVIVLCREL